jgi:protein tyrosine phosphatase
VGTTFPCSTAKLSENNELNRFPHLLAYDHSRVKLVRQNDTDSDYINANYIHGYDRRRKAYIAAQSPFSERTICDFWLMIFQQHVSKIVFIAHLVEDSIVKCEQYWSDDNTEHSYGDIKVTLLSVLPFAHFVIRKFQIVLQNVRRIVEQYQFLSWPEHGVPKEPLTFLEFHDKITSDTTDDSPLLVHCGTGVSRTAVYIAVDYSLKKAKQENCVNVYRCCAAMRQCRPMMLRTLKQYKFVYDVLFDALLTHHTVLGSDISETYRLLNRINQQTNLSYFHEQFKVLETYIDKPSVDSCTVGLSETNKPRNRFSTLHLIARDSDRPVLRGPLAVSDYINALYIDSYKQRKTFIVTQTPLSNTLDDFWAMVVQCHVRCIVSMNGPDYVEDTCIDYWPTQVGSAIQTPNGFVVTLLNTVTTQHVVVRKLEFAADTITHVVMQFQFLSWKMYDQVPWSRDGFLELLDMVQKESIDDNTSSVIAPVVVHCADGASQSGLFCACWTVCEKMKYDQQVDIFHTVKALKLRRFHFINLLVQYKFCFKLLWDYISTRLSQLG